MVARSAVVLVVGLGALLLTIGARSPYTHANLDPAYDARYTRSDQILVGSPEPYAGSGPAAGAAGGGEIVPTGARLYVTKGCAACHGLAGRGGTVGPPVAGTDLETLQKKARKGPGGMPHYAPETLTDEELAAIAAYLGSITAQPAPSLAR